MSRRGNCWDNAPQESFYGHMKDHIGGMVKQCTEFQEVKTIVDDYMDYYNNEEYVWELCMLSPNEYYDFVTTGVYPLAIENPPQFPEIQKSPESFHIHNFIIITKNVRKKYKSRNQKECLTFSF